MKRTVAVAAVALAGAAVGAAAFVARDRADAAPAGAATVSTKGTRVAVGGSTRRMLHAYGYDGLRLLAVVGDHAYYSVPSDSGACYAVGFANAIGVPGAIRCWRTPRPIMDFTLVEAVRTTGRPRAYQIEGIAADGIDALDLVGAGGGVVASTKVSHNAFQFAGVGQGGARLVAHDVDGKEVAAEPLP